LKETSDFLDSKSLTITELEAQIHEFKASLTAASSDIEAKTVLVNELEKAKQAAENELTETKETLTKLQSEGQDNNLILQSVQNQVGRDSLLQSTFSLYS
jgi:chromosome segregation ATPase